MTEEKSVPADPQILKHAHTQYRFYTVTASTVSRTLAISGLGILWLFSGRDASSPKTTLEIVENSGLLSTVLGAFIAALVLDLAQYFVAAALWGSFQWALNEVLHNDLEPKISLWSRYAWRVARRLKIMAMLRGPLKVDANADFKVERNQMREKLRSPSAGNPSLRTMAMASMQDATSSPPVINGVTAWLFFLKGLAVAVGFVVLAAYLF